jgi:hypothetical protein
MNAIVESKQGAIQSQPTGQLSAGPMANAIIALQAGMTVEQMQGLMNLQKDYEANEARKAYVADMAEFKKHPPEIFKTKLVSFSGTEYMHATLGDVTKAVVNALAEYGFSHSWETKQENGVISVTCKITHRLGHSESTTMMSPPDVSGKKNSIQAIASAQTYLSRYTLLQSCGLATMDMPDDDGYGYGRNDFDQPPPEYRKQQQQQGNGLPPYSDDQFAKNLPTWRGLIESGKKTADQVIATVASRANMTEEQKAMVRATVTQ